MNWIRRIGLLAVLAAAVVALAATTVSAATISEVVDDVSATGFYLDSGVSISESEASEIVNHARNEGSRFHLVVLGDSPLGGNTTFAEAVYDDLGIDAGTVLVLSPDDVGVFTNDEGFSADTINAALDYADEIALTDGEYAAAVVVGLVGPVDDGGATAPTAVPQTTAAPGSSGGDGGSGLLWLLVIVVGGGLFLLWMMRRGQRQTVNAAAEGMAKARAAVQKQVDAIANDILDMEDEVRTADNAEVDSFYNQASATYQTVTERLQQADTPQELVDLSNDLDVAIWELDCAEAVLDGKPKPPKPEPKRLEPELAPEERVTIPAPRSDYQRRPGRRSSYAGPGVMEILIGVAGQVLAGGGRRGGPGGLGGLFGGRPGPRGSSTPTARGGGGVVPGPGAPVPSSSRSTPRPSRSTRRRSGGGRVRVGRRRGRRK